MNSMETKKKIEDRITLLEQRMFDRYEMVFEVFGKKCFKVRENEFFMITGLSWANAIVIEHALSEEDAKKNMFEDGDLFDIYDLSEDEMFQAMIFEIENE